MMYTLQASLKKKLASVFTVTYCTSSDSLCYIVTKSSFALKSNCFLLAKSHDLVSCGAAANAIKGYRVLLRSTHICAKQYELRRTLPRIQRNAEIKFSAKSPLLRPIVLMRKLDGRDYECPLIATRSESPVRHDTVPQSPKRDASRERVGMPMEWSQ
jgi:hypothetical protein